MNQPPSLEPKPRNEQIRHHLTRYPDLPLSRQRFRKLCVGIGKILMWVVSKVEISGLENFPKEGPALLVINHLGDGEVPLAIGHLPVQPDFFAKAELYDLPVAGKFFDRYGVIWIHRGQPDRRALRAGFQVLEDGRFLLIAPEGRQSTTGGLEEGTGGAAYVALKADVPVVPIAFTGTENANIFGPLKRFRRGQVSMTVGKPFQLDKSEGMREGIETGTQIIMENLASLLPAEYQGVYRQEDKNEQKLHNSPNA